MHRGLLAGCVISAMVLAVAGAAFTQTAVPPDDSLSPMEVLTQAAMPAAGATPPQGADAGAAGTTGETAKPGVTKKVDPVKASDRSAEYLAQCLRDWDAGTHMTKQEWARTCRRVVSNRVKFLREQGQ